MIFQNTSVIAPISSVLICDVLSKLSFSEHRDAKSISNAIYGIGLIAKAGRLEGRIELSFFHVLLNFLTSSRPEAQAISSTLYGLGELAKSGRLDGVIDISLFQSLLGLLERSRPQALHISNTVYGLGEIGKSGRLDGVIDISLFQSLWSLLARSAPEPKHILTLLYGLGELGKSGRLVGKVDIASFQGFLSLIVTSKQDFQAVSNTLYGLGELGKSGRLDGVIDISLFQSLLDLLATSASEPQNISNTVYGLGELGKSGRLIGKIDISLFQRLLDLLAARGPSVQSISNTVYGLGELGKSGQLVGKIDIASFEALLDLLAARGPRTQDVSNTLYGLGQLAKFGKLRGQIEGARLDSFFEKVDLDGFHNIDLEQTLLGLSELRFSGSGVINKLFRLLLSRSYVHPGECITILHFYTNLSRDNVIKEGYFERLCSYMDAYRFDQFSATQQQRLREILSVLDEHHRIRLEVCLGLGTTAISANDAEVLPDESMIEEDAVGPAPSRAPEGARIIYRTNASRAPVPDTYQTEKERSQIFNAIANEDLRALEKLLGISAPTPSHQQVKSKEPRFSFMGVTREEVARREGSRVDIDNKRTANRLVSHFLERTEPEALKYLIAHSRHDYFERMLRACSKHEQYQFAIRKALHLILLHLPSKELDAMISDLIVLGFYRDHRATLSLIDGLQLRRLSHSDESLLLHTRQEELMHEAIRHHEQHHPHVTETLMGYRTSLSTHPEEMAAFTEIRNELLEAQVSLAPVSEIAPVVREPAVVRQAPVFVEQSLMQANEEANMNACYSAETVQKLLSLKLDYMGGERDIALFAPLDYAEVPEGGVILTRLLEHLGNQEEVASTEMLLPICISNDWVGLRLIVNEAESAVECTYYDSLSSEPYKDVVGSAAVNAVKEVYAGFSVSFRVHSRYKQQDGSSCGAYLIENMMHDLRPSVISKKCDAELFRNAHLRFLRERDPIYYDKHLQMAQANANASISGSSSGQRPISLVSASLFRSKGVKRAHQEAFDSAQQTDRQYRKGLG